MKSGNLMKDPFYAQIIHAVEVRIHDFDETARRAGVSLTDSNIKSAIRQALGRLKDNPPKSDGADERGKQIEALGVDLTVLCSVQQVKTADYLKALLAVEDSLKTRREMAGHSRGYLDFLKRFIETGSLH
jgi:hypothetical protein